MEDLFSLVKKPIVFLDLETTGLQPNPDRIIEVAAIRWDKNGRNVYSQIVNPGVKVPRNITKLTGISQSQVNKGIPIKDAIEEFYQTFLQDSPVIVAHNAPFDLKFLDYEFSLIDIPPWSGPVACTLRLSRKYISTHNGRHRLGDVAATLDIPLKGVHRALTDIEACEQVFIYLWPQMEQEKRKPWRKRTPPKQDDPKPFTRTAPKQSTYKISVDISEIAATNKPSNQGCGTTVLVGIMALLAVVLLIM